MATAIATYAYVWLRLQLRMAMTTCSYGYDYGYSCVRLRLHLYTLQGQRKLKLLGGALRGLVEPRDIVLNLVTHVVTKELPKGQVPHKNYWGDQCLPAPPTHSPHPSGSGVPGLRLWLGTAIVRAMTGLTPTNLSQYFAE